MAKSAKYKNGDKIIHRGNPDLIWVVANNDPVGKAANWPPGVMASCVNGQGDKKSSFFSDDEVELVQD